MASVCGGCGDISISPAHSAPPSAGRGRRDRRRDALTAILGPGEKSRAFYTGVTVALAFHVALLLIANLIGLFGEMRFAVVSARARLNEYFWARYEVDLAPKAKIEVPKPPEEPPPPPDPPPAAAPLPKSVAKPKDDPYDQPPPTPAQAAKVLTQKEDPDDVKDLTATTIVSGDGTATYGQQSGSGTGNRPTMNLAASLRGAPGGTGTGPIHAPPPPPPAADLSRRIALGGSKSWNCPFPPEADTDQIDQAVVTVQVTVRPDGSVLSANILSDPGHGFGRAARMCALGKRFSPALDRSGTAILSSEPLTIRFSR